MKLKSLLFQNFIILIFISISFSRSYSQENNFITRVSKNETYRNKSIENYESKTRDNPNIKLRTYVRIGKLAEILKGNQLSINIPTLEKSIESKQTSFIIKNENDYEWIGETDEGRGFVIIISSGGRSHIQISTPNYACEIVPVTNDIYSLQELDLIKVNEIGCVTNHEKNDINKISEQTLNKINDQFLKQNSRQDPCSEQINPRVLFLYGTPALIYAGGVTQIENIATASITLFNQAIGNSAINNNAQLVSAGVVYLSGFTEYFHLDRTLDSLKINATANSLRNTYQADIVVYFCDSDNIDTRGIAGTLDVESEDAYSVVQIWASATNKTFAHEIGHIFGCRHDNHSSPTHSYARGYNIRNAIGFIVDRTLMTTTSSDGINRLVNFSNPDISVSGRATGTSEYDNARRIDETWSTVGNFRINPPNPPSAIIGGPSYVTSPGHYTFEAIYKCFVGPFNFQWQVSTDGGATYSTVSSTTDTYTHYIGHSQTLHIKCIIGSFYNAHTTVYAVMEEVVERVSPPINSTIQFSEDTNTPIYAYPNPSNRIFKFPYTVSENSTVTLKITSSNGKVYIPVRNLIHKTAGNYEATWDANEKDTGVYIFQFEIDGKITAGKIILTKDL